MFYAIKNFTIELAELLSSSQNGYKTCAEDICSIFKDETFDTIFEMKAQLNNSADRLIKLRVCNSGQKLGTSGGFRLYFVADSINKRVVFLSIYPKRGKSAKIKLTSEETKAIIDQYKEFKLKNAFIEVDITKGLTEKKEIQSVEVNK